MRQTAIAKERLQNALILVVDDVEVNRTVLIRSLNNRGYGNVIVADDGAKALQLTHERKPDLVILDLVMPGMDGFAYCQAVRHDAAYDNMPIIVQTMLEKLEDKLKAFHLGASDYICKPIDPDELSARTHVHLVKKMLIEDLRAYRERVSAEMEAARNMQNRLMPDNQHIAMCERIFDMDIAAHFETSSSISGDSWGMRPLSEKKLAVYMYDFSGHGISAALNIFRTHTIMQECLQTGGDPGYFLQQMNRRLHPLLDRNEFATMFYGVLDSEANCLTYATAASTTPLLFCRSEPKPVSLNGQGFPLGVTPTAHYETRYTPFMPGDMLLLFSDCLTETKNAGGEFLEEEQIKECAAAALRESNDPAQAAIDALLKAFRKHSALPINDDLTMCGFGRR